MPLTKSPSKTAFNKNVRTEIRAGTSRKQALAIAFTVQRKAARKKTAGQKAKT